MVCNKCGHPKHMHRKRPIFGEGDKHRCNQSLINTRTNKIMPCPCDGYKD